MLNIEDIRNYALGKEDVTEGFPFGESALVFKTKGKMFLLVSLEAQPLSLNAKCDPEKAVLLREEFPAVLPGYHMNKKHWNTVLIDGSLSDGQIRDIIDHSFDLVRKKK